MAKRPRDTPGSSSDSEEEEVESIAKYTHIDATAATSEASLPAIRCFLPPHRPYSFSSYEEFDSHYHKSHVNRCSECTRNFPTEHFLNLHIAEVHDSLAEAKRARGDKTYGCFLEDCDKMCYSPQKRRLHLIDKHHFPKNYNFFITKDGLDKRHSMLVPRTRQRRMSQQMSQTTAEVKDDKDISATGEVVEDIVPEVESSQSPEATSSIASPDAAPVMTPTSSIVDADMDSLTSNMSSLKFVPNSVRFGRGGRGRGRGGFAQRRLETR